ncbi:hypothetical protein RchiOBHm_Chr3g0469241 [Rosa chinensis]|uniref:Uncharacterized protein n=1 Tax=Rosa chinensis TaxID=74649 RepID=A0A2P6RAQ4_ROSCH|nr:hypothetical protein RchiOBHm_Chr3g0469241 [Rosa chinensis]
MRHRRFNWREGRCIPAILFLLSLGAKVGVSDLLCLFSFLVYVFLALCLSSSAASFSYALLYVVFSAPRSVFFFSPFFVAV